MGSAGTLFVGIIASAFGAGYFLYGKKQGQAMPMFAGAALCIYPYLVSNLALSILIGVALLAAPFIWRF